MPYHKMCPRCGVEVGTPRNPQAKGSDLCLECAQDMDRTDDSAAEEGPGIEDSDSYRDAMRESGRGHLAR
jgi:RNA polymerase-binding transcription factor DksA